MAKQLQLRRGTTEQNNAFVGAEGELTYDTQAKQLRIHDGSTAGGKKVICGNSGYVYIVQEATYINETGRWAWYRLWSNNWVEIYANVQRENWSGIHFPFTMSWVLTGQITGAISGNGPRYATITNFTNSVIEFRGADDSSWNDDGLYRIFVAGYKA